MKADKTTTSFGSNTSPLRCAAALSFSLWLPDGSCAASGKTLTQDKENKETSTITQDQETIAIKCKTFTLDAETITCTSTKATKHESKDTFDLKSTKDMTFDSSAKLVEKAKQDCTIEGQNVKIGTESGARDEA